MTAMTEAWRVIPLLAGVAELAAFVGIGRFDTTGSQIAEFLPGFVLIVAGLVLAGPWLTMIGSRAMARRARRPAPLIASRRLSDNPRAGFRAISGLTLALFVTTVAGGTIIALDSNYGHPSAGIAGSDTLVDEFSAGQAGYSGSVPAPDTVLTQLRSVRGVTGVSVTRSDPIRATIPAAVVGQPASWGRMPAGLISCAELARTPCSAAARPARRPR
jgi:hypothetical protein